MKYDSAKDATAGDAVSNEQGATGYVLTNTCDGYILVLWERSQLITLENAQHLHIRMCNG